MNVPPAAQLQSNALRDDELLRVEGLTISFAAGPGRLRAVNGASWAVGVGRSLAIVGESGSGKSVSALSLLRVAPAGARIDAGRALFRSSMGVVDTLALAGTHLRALRGREIAFVFQEPVSSLNPVLTVGEQIAEAARRRGLSRRAAASEAVRALARVAIPDAPRRARAYPHEFSGGMCQRAMVAMALAARPRLLIADEPTSALDPTTQVEVLGLISALRRDEGMGLVFITHDLRLARAYADDLCVMYGGHVVETGPARSVLDAPAHPYTRALLACVPGVVGTRDRLPTVADLTDAPPSAWLTPSGDHAWWPWRPPPLGTPADDAGIPRVALAPAGPGRAVAVWASAA